MNLKEIDAFVDGQRECAVGCLARARAAMNTAPSFRRDEFKENGFGRAQAFYALGLLDDDEFFYWRGQFGH